MTDTAPTPSPALRLPRQQHRIVQQALVHWQQAGQIDAELAQRLGAGLEVMPFDWKRAARYAFLFSLACIVIAVGAALADAWLMQLLSVIFDAPPSAKCLGLTVIAAGFFGLALRLRGRAPGRPYRNGAVMALGVFALAAAIGYLGEALDDGSGRIDLLFLLAAALYLGLGAAFPSTLVWVFGLLSLGAWMGARTGYFSGSGAYFLGMEKPLTFVVFGSVLAALALGAEAWASARRARGEAGPAALQALAAMARPTLVMGLLYLFIALWILSIFGAYDDIDLWRRAGPLELLHWSLLFAAVAAGALWHGLKHDDGVLRGFGLTFLFINLYTRFFEFFWNHTHKALFFAVLAASFWWIGSRAEKIWQFGRRPAPPQE